MKTAQLYKLLSLVLVLAFILQSCRKDPSPFNIQNLNGNKISAFGHAGMGLAFKYPTNSYESLETVLRIGADGTEMDVQMTKDSVLVIYHDPTLESSTSMHGMVNELTWAELQNCVYASPLSTNLKLQKAEDILTQLGDDVRVFTFDCKLYNRSNLDYNSFINTYANALVALISKHNARQLSYIESGDPNFLSILKNKDSELKLFTYPESFEQGLATADNLDLFGITIDNTIITEEQVKLAHAHGRRVTLWEVQTENDNIDAIKKSPDFIQSDKIIHLLQIFDGYKKQGWKNLQW